MAERNQTTFITGATGFLGSFLLRELLQRERRVMVMLREPFDQARGRLRHVMDVIGVDVDAAVGRGRVVLVPGSLPDSLPDVGELAPDDVLACAASLQIFSNGTDEPFHTNVTGTLRLIEWARRQGVRSIHAVSTAYVCGSYTDHVGERLHLPRPEFQTEYERSKWEAEYHLADWGNEPDNTLTIYRPSFLVGDSTSGYTSQYGGFYQFARVVSLLKQEYGRGDNSASTLIPLRIPGRPGDPQNFVPVDFAARVIAEIMERKRFQGRIYHLTDPAPVTNGQIKKYLEAYFNMHGGHFVEHDRVIHECTSAESLMWEQYQAMTPRVTHNPRFEQSNTGELMRAAGIAFPAMTRERFFMLLDYAIASRWGRGLNGKALH